AEEGVTLAGAGGHSMTASARRFARDRWALVGLVFLVVLATVAAVAPVLVERVLHASAYRLGMMSQVRVDGHLVDVVSEGGVPLGPNPHYPLGADLIGRDVLSRLIYGARVSLLVSTMGTLLAVFLGLVVGLLAGFYRGAVDTV